ncbi:MAG: UDP-N-acetylmuramate dehydrogenase [Acidiferrobacterales bacterium]|nr:UDP-N-acetylmuramate dehydrogenase [Acidiferrobacterales bacterium]
MSIDVQYNASLQAYNSMAVPAQAHALVQVTSLEQLKQALSFARQQEIDVLVLGEGSNTVFQDDYPGLVILNRLRGIELLNQNDTCVTVRAAAGENWHDFVEHTIRKSWYGLENLALIPGLVGAAPMQNIGAYGVEVKDRLLSLDYLDIKTGEVVTLHNSDCQFAYRESCFKHQLAGKAIILSVTFELSKKPEVELSYPALAACFENTPSPEQVFQAVIDIRRSKLPMPESIPNTGSFFKNPVVDKAQHAALKKQYPDLVSFKTEQGVKLAAGWMIDQAGWKSRDHQGVCVHELQALVIVNPLKRSGKVVLEFAEQIQKDIENRFGVLLEIEPRRYP